MKAKKVDTGRKNQDGGGKRLSVCAIFLVSLFYEEFFFLSLSFEVLL